jgi:hypothetical protein
MIVTVLLNIPDTEDTDHADVLASVHARLADEAGFLDTGEPLIPLHVSVDFDWPALDDMTLLAICENARDDKVGRALTVKAFAEHERRETED